MSPVPGPVLDRLRAALAAAGYRTDTVRALLGPHAHAALGRGEPEPAARRAGDGPLGRLVRLLLLGDALPADDVADALGSPVAELLAAGLVRETAGGVTAALDLRPYADDAGELLVLSDLGAAAAQHREHVTGVGAASLHLATATVRRPVETLLDLGTGCGVQALHGTRHARAVTATDVAPRALALAAATFALNEVDVELLAGRWTAPVAGRRFDQVVSNPPFVIGPGRVEQVYRDSGQAGDAALAALVGALPAHLAPGGVAQLLGAWVHVRGGDWTERVRGWLPTGVDAWVLQREVVDPALHVGTWQRDGARDPAEPAARRQAGEWLDWFAAHDVEAVGFGYLTLRRTDRIPVVVVEELPDGGLTGAAVAGWLDAVDWLRDRDDAALLAARLRLTPTTVLERWWRPGEAGWIEGGATVRATVGPGWTHEVDGPAAALLAGCAGGLPLGELYELLGLAHGTDPGALATASLPAVRELVRHGILVPA